MKRSRPRRAAEPKPVARARTTKKAQRPAPRTRSAPGKRPARRADLGAPIDGFFSKQPPRLRAILEALRELAEGAAPDATASLKWGMPFYTIGHETMCALAGFKSHVNLILPGPPGTFADPDGLLEGEGKTGRHLKLRTLDELPRAAVRRWLRTAAEIAREKAASATSRTRS